MFGATLRGSGSCATVAGTTTSDSSRAARTARIARRTLPRQDERRPLSALAAGALGEALALLEGRRDRVGLGTQQPACDEHARRLAVESLAREVLEQRAQEVRDDGRRRR